MLQGLSESTERLGRRMTIALDDEVALVTAEDAADRDHLKSPLPELVGEGRIGVVPQQHREVRSEALAGQLRRSGDNPEVEFALDLVALAGQPEHRLQESLRGAGLAE